jgi:hypothetical protein
MRKGTRHEKEGMCNGSTAREGENATEKTGKRTAARHTDEKTLTVGYWVVSAYCTLYTELVAKEKEWECTARPSRQRWARDMGGRQRFGVTALACSGGVVSGPPIQSGSGSDYVRDSLVTVT